MDKIVVMPLRGELNSLRKGVKVWPLYARGEITYVDVSVNTYSEKWQDITAHSIWAEKPVHLNRNIVLTQWAEIPPPRSGVSAIHALSAFVQLNSKNGNRFRNRFILGIFPEPIQQKNESQVIGFVVNLIHLEKSRG